MSKSRSKTNTKSPVAFCFVSRVFFFVIAQKRGQDGHMLRVARNLIVALDSTRLATASAYPLPIAIAFLPRYSRFPVRFQFEGRAAERYYRTSSSRMKNFSVCCMLK